MEETQKGIRWQYSRDEKESSAGTMEDFKALGGMPEEMQLW